MMNPFRFGMPPEDAVDDPDALAGAIGHENPPIFGDNEDIPRAIDANPFKTPDGMQKMMPRGNPGMSMPGMMQRPGAFADEEALRQAILDQAMSEREMSRAYQSKVVDMNESEIEERKKAESGDV